MNGTPLHLGEEFPLPAYALWAFGIGGRRRVDGYTARVSRISAPLTACGLPPLVVITCPEIPALPEWTLLAATREELAAQLCRARWMTARRAWATIRRVWEAGRAAREFATAAATVTGIGLALVVIAWRVLAPYGLGPAQALLGGLVLATVVTAARRWVRRRGAR